MDLNTLINQTRKADANPGGGAILILVSNLAINLMLMMDKNNWEDLEEKASVSRETIIKYSEKLKVLMQVDVDNFNELMDKINAKSADKEDYISAARALMDMVDMNLKSLEILSFYLENGKKYTLTDGQIANELLDQAILSAMPTIRVNLENTNFNYDYDGIVKRSQLLAKQNEIIIERRRKWQEYMLF